MQPASVLVKLKLALRELVGFDGVAGRCVVSGAGVSTVQVKLAGVASVLPAASMARTWKVWLPSAGRYSSAGEAQATKLPASSLHSKVSRPRCW